MIQVISLFRIIVLSASLLFWTSHAQACKNSILRADPVQKPRLDQTRFDGQGREMLNDVKNSQKIQKEIEIKKTPSEPIAPINHPGPVQEDLRQRERLNQRLLHDKMLRKN